MVIKWWIIGIILGFSFCFATPDHLVDKHWDNDFLLLPFRMANSMALRIMGRIKLFTK
jgi:hypothetical protein